MRTLQGYLAHKNPPPPPLDHHRAPGIVLLEGPRGGGGLMSEVPLYGSAVPDRVTSLIRSRPTHPRTTVGSSLKWRAKTGGSSPAVESSYFEAYTACGKGVYLILVLRTLVGTIIQRNTQFERDPTRIALVDFPLRNHPIIAPTKLAKTCPGAWQPVQHAHAWCDYSGK